MGRGARGIAGKVLQDRNFTGRRDSNFRRNKIPRKHDHDITRKNYLPAVHCDKLAKNHFLAKM